MPSSKGADFAACLDLVPKPISTGDRIILGKISKRGNRYLRVLFVQAAWVAMDTCVWILDHLLLRLEQAHRSALGVLGLTRPAMDGFRRRALSAGTASRRGPFGGGTACGPQF